MPYLYKRVVTKNRDFISRTRVLSYVISSEKKRRGVRLYRTSEPRRERNRRNAIIRLKYLLYNNLDIGDWWITLTNSEKRDPLEAHKALMYELSKISKKLRRKGIPFVYFVKTEAGERQRAHHHLFIKNNCEGIAEMVVKAWQKYGRIADQRQIYNLENGKLISYFLDGGNHKELEFEKFSHSRNLEEPRIETRIYPAQSFREVPVAPEREVIFSEGKEILVKYEIENLYNGYSDSAGCVYQYYELKKTREPFDFVALARERRRE